jgi:hypothetical protein
VSKAFADQESAPRPPADRKRPAQASKIAISSALLAASASAGYSRQINITAGNELAQPQRRSFSALPFVFASRLVATHRSIEPNEPIDDGPGCKPPRGKDRGRSRPARTGSRISLSGPRAERLRVRCELTFLRRKWRRCTPIAGSGPPPTATPALNFCSLARLSRLTAACSGTNCSKRGASNPRIQIGEVEEFWNQNRSCSSWNCDRAGLLNTRRT